MTQTLWIGCLESDEEFQRKARKGYDLASAQVSQQNLIRGLEQTGGVVFDSVNGSVLPPYPTYADRVIEPVAWSHREGAADVSVGYSNDRYINRLNCRRSMVRAAETWVNTRYRGGELIVFAYSMRSAPMAAASRVKRMIPDAKLYLLVTDLPQFMDLGQSRVKALLKKIDWLSIKRMQGRFDGFICYAAKMAEYLKIPGDKWLLMEGSYDEAESITPVSDGNGERAILYSGRLDREYGVALLLDAFMGMEREDIRLWLTGRGNAEPYIRECAQKDARIRFFGFLPDRGDVLRLQRKAALLVNMRLPSEEASEYCFPSKLLEYMASGVPVLSFRLGGIPEEYDPYLVVAGGESADALREAIRGGMAMDDTARRSLGERAREFVLTVKSPRMQSERIWNWIGKERCK